MAPDIAWDYVIVGSGAGGGTLAARLAEAGMRVLLLEAGGDPREGAPGLPEDYDVPALHPFASENPGMSWSFFVRHYADDAKQAADPKHVEDPDTGRPSVLYPRAAGLGGCTAHNAMIFVAPHDSDWNDIADRTGDESWRADKMQPYLRRLEACRHRPIWRFLRRFGLDPTAHGWDGWLPAERARPRRIRDWQLFRLLFHTGASVVLGAPSWGAAMRRLMRGEADPNDARRLRDRADGLCYTPLSTDRHRRIGARERALEAARRWPDRLHIELHALATKVLFDGAKRAVGVEYLSGERLYAAHDDPGSGPGAPRTARAAREVILAGGAFNTPQLLMLSGVGPRDELERHGLPVVQALDGVGRNLQDRYEVGVVHRMARPWSSLKGATFDRSDRLYRAWRDRRDGMYISNGAAIAFTLRSTPGQFDPDVFCMALLTRFTGYFPGYARELRKHLDYLTFAVLKAHTNNRAGRVRLRSTDPRQRPDIDFHYFDEAKDGDEGAKEDLAAVVAGIRAVRKITAPMRRRGWLGPEELPGEALASDEDLAAHVRAAAWGHHASCTCPIGRQSEGGVLDSEFRVHGVRGLRVVDASSFPRIPGFFIASAVFIIAEKAADVILRDARESGEGGEPRDSDNNELPQPGRLEGAALRG